jgi:hypothetical protein
MAARRRSYPLAPRYIPFATAKDLKSAWSNVSDGRRLYRYADLAVAQSSGSEQFQFLGKQRLASGVLVNLWERIA